jgi:hypothetical protein
MLTLTPAVLQQLKARGLQVPQSSALNLPPFFVAASKRRTFDADA